jgi:hypothetical protein
VAGAELRIFRAAPVSFRSKSDPRVLAQSVRPTGIEIFLSAGLSESTSRWRRAP